MTRWKESIILVILIAGILYFAASPYFHGKVSNSTLAKGTSSFQLTTEGFQNLSISAITPKATNASAWWPVVTNGQLIKYARIASGHATPFVFNLTNTGDSVLHITGYSTQFTLPDGSTEGPIIGVITVDLYPKHSALIYVTYGTNLPTFSSGYGKLVFVVYGENNAWSKSITIPLAFG